MGNQYSPEEKKRQVLRVYALREEGMSIAEACMHLKLNRATFYLWRRLVAEAIKGDDEALEPKSRSPKRLARKTPSEVEKRVIEMALSGIFKSANAISKAMLNERVIHAGTVINILEGAGLYGVIEVRDQMGALVKKKRGMILP